MKRRIILSPCGTSLLTNPAHSDFFEGLVLRNYTNLSRNEIRDEVSCVFDKAIDTIEKQLQNENIEGRKKLSAELNAIYTLDNGQVDKTTIHLLVATDTYLGIKTAELIRKILISDGVGHVEILRISGLRTDSLTEFRVALSELVKMLDQLLINYRQSGYEVIFNLTGGFKSIQGFLQSIAPFYADRSIYIFEGGRELLTIPTLPVRQNDLETIRDNITLFRRLDLELECPPENIDKLPEIYWWHLGGEYALTEWGTLAFKKAREVLYTQQLFEPPSDRILVDTDRLKKWDKMFSSKMKKEFNETMDDMARAIEKGLHLKSLTMKELKGKPKVRSTHECYLNSDDAKRIFYHIEGGSYIIDEIGEHL